MTGAHRHRPKLDRHRLRRPLHIAAVTVGAAAVASWSLGPTFAAADSGDVKVVNTETVQVYTDAEGAVDTQRVYEQVELSGEGTVTLENPIALEGLRNLDGFGGVETEDGSQVTTTTIDGVEQLRSVSEFDGDLPLEVSATYELDGERVEPGDVVGESGHLVVEYTIKNVSGVATDITYPDGRGGEVSDTVDVPIPMVGSLTTVAPPTFDEVTSAQANMAGDGKGGTRLSFTATLIPPIGDDTAVFGYEADITDGVVPRADFTGLPVNPLKSPSFASAAKSYQGGAQTGVALTEGAVEIDDNLLKLRDGAGDLLAGLIKLQAGSEELSAGLVGEAAPGAEELAAGLNDDAAPGADLLADGASELSDGLGDLDEGAAKLAGGNAALNVGVGVLAGGTGELRVGALKLADGADQVADGAGRLAGGSTAALDGSQQLTAGLGQLSAGLQQLKGMDGLPKAAAGVKALQDGVDLLIAGLGGVDQPATLIGGLHRLASPEGLPAAVTGAQQLGGGLGQLRGTTPTATSPGSGLGSAKGGVDKIAGGLGQLTADGGGFDQLNAAIGAAAGTDGCKSDSCAQILSGVQQKVNAELKPGVGEAVTGLSQVSGGLQTAISTIDSLLVPGANKLAGQLQTAAQGAAALEQGAVDGRAGAAKIAAGLDDLSIGLAGAVEGVLALSTGADSAFLGGQDLTAGLGTLDEGAADLAAGTDTLSEGGKSLAAGTGTLASGVGELGDGAQELADGSSELAAGADRAADGSQELTAGAVKLSAGIGLAATGSQELADGLGDAADGSVQLADGLVTAADGAPQLVDGAQRLSDEGTKVLIGKGEDTATSYGEMYASLVAGAERADTDDMAYGAPEGAQGLTAYSFVLQGEDGAGGRNLGRGLLAAGAAALAGGGLLIRRRFLV